MPRLRKTAESGARTARPIVAKGQRNDSNRRPEPRTVREGARTDRARAAAVESILVRRAVRLGLLLRRVGLCAERLAVREIRTREEDRFRTGSGALCQRPG